MATRINLKAFRQSIARDLDRATQREIHAIALARFREIKSTILNRFDQHPVTVEIKAGPQSSTNPSRTLGGVFEGNLYSFIGFELEKDPDPTEALRAELEREMRFTNLPIKSFVGSVRRYRFLVFGPTFEQLEKVCPMPWGTARSWIRAIEDGIPGINYYLFRQRGGFRPWDGKKGSRSTTAVQSKRVVRPGASFSKRTYVTEILNEYRRSFI